MSILFDNNEIISGGLIEPKICAEYSVKIDNITAEMIDNKEVSALISGFVLNSNNIYYLNRSYIACFEYYAFCSKTRSNDYANKPILFYNLKHSYDDISYFQDIGYDIDATQFFCSELRQLIELMTIKYKFENYSDAAYSTYKALLLIAQDIFNEKALLELETIFYSSNCKSVDDYVCSFCENELLTPQNEVMRGLFVHYLMAIGQVDSSSHFMNHIDGIVSKIDERLNYLKIQNFERKLITKNSTTSSGYNISDIDLMNGLEFETFLSILFTKLGYKVRQTKYTGDQGIDIVAEKNNIRLAVQAKCYAKQVNNAAIQQVVAGSKHYNCDKTIVVTNNYFTKSAIELAESNNVLLWDRKILKDKISELFN